MQNNIVGLENKITCLESIIQKLESKVSSLESELAKNNFKIQVRVTSEKYVLQFECNICKIYFKYENSLTCHTKNIHIYPKCKVCKTTFQDEADLIDHWEDTKVYCKDCKKCLNEKSHENHISKDHQHSKQKLSIIEKCFLWPPGHYVAKSGTSLIKHR